MRHRIWRVYDVGWNRNLNPFVVQQFAATIPALAVYDSVQLLTGKLVDREWN
jgi:hypothetical protein